MIFRITLKDPDGVANALDKAADGSIDNIGGLDEDEREALLDLRREKIRDVCKDWIQYDEYIVLEVNTEDGTCEVIHTSKL